MSGSFHPPGLAYLDNPTCLSRMETKDVYLFEISPVVLQEFPIGLAHTHTDYSPHWHIEKKICLPDLFNASLIGGYLILEDILLL